MQTYNPKGQTLFARQFRTYLYKIKLFQLFDVMIGYGTWSCNGVGHDASSGNSDWNPSHDVLRQAQSHDLEGYDSDVQREPLMLFWEEALISIADFLVASCTQLRVV